METNNLNRNKADILTSGLKSIVGSVPFAGSFLSEIISNVIPNQRYDRITKYLGILEKKLSCLNEKYLQNLLNNEEAIDLLEESFFQAARAITQKRRGHIAEIVKNGFSKEHIGFCESKYLLKILQEINDQEIIWLRYYMCRTLYESDQFQKRFPKILTPVIATMASDETIVEKQALQESYTEHLERLGLVSYEYEINHETETPEFDSFTGKQKVSYTTITTFGKLILKQIGEI